MSTSDLIQRLTRPAPPQRPWAGHNWPGALAARIVFAHPNRASLERLGRTITATKSNARRHEAISLLLAMLDDHGLDDLHDLPSGEAFRMAMHLEDQAAGWTKKDWVWEYAYRERWEATGR